MTEDRDRLIVSLDLPNALEALRLVNQLESEVNFFKIGLGMLTGGGLALADELKQKGKRVFLDMKLFDIPATIEAAVAGLVRYEMDFLTIHGDPNVVRAAVAGRGERPTKLLAVTFLTSVDRTDLDLALIRNGDMGVLVQERARLALQAGADGVIAAVEDARAIRDLPEAAGKLIVSPGIRPLGAAAGDQKRIATPASAMAAGSDHIVVGRPVRNAPDPLAVARAIQEEIAGVPAV